MISIASNRNCIVIGVNRIRSVAASYVSLMYRIVGYASRYVSYRPQDAFTPDANEANKSRVVGRLNSLSLFASFAREIHYTTDVNSRHGRGFCQAAPVSLQNIFLFL